MRLRRSFLAPLLFLAFALSLAPVASPAFAEDTAALHKQCRQTADQAHKLSKDLHVLARKRGIEPTHHRKLLESAGKLEADAKKLKALAESDDASAIQFEIQMATSDMQNAESVRSEVEMALKNRK